MHNASVISLVFTLALAFAGPFELTEQDSPRGKSMGNKITIRIGDKAFAATLSDNPTAITMTELNRNEKFARLSKMYLFGRTPASIRTGDLMLYGSDSLVLFYKSFRTTYSYTAIGRIDDPEGLEGALGTGDVDVTFAIDQDRH